MVFWLSLSFKRFLEKTLLENAKIGLAKVCRLRIPYKCMPTRYAKPEYTKVELKSDLTETQKTVYRFLKESFYENGSMPTLREICQFMNWKAVGSAQDVVQALIEKSYLTRHPLKARALQLAEAITFRAVPILGAAPAGPPVEAIESHEGDAAIPDFIRGPVFAIRVQGDSMMNAGIEDGDLVIVKQVEEARHGQIIVALVDGETTIKRFERRGRGLYLVPENPRYKEKKVSSESFKVLGIVIGLHRYWEAL